MHQTTSNKTSTLGSKLKTVLFLAATLHTSVCLAASSSVDDISEAKKSFTSRIPSISLSQATSPLSMAIEKLSLSPISESSSFSEEEGYASCDESYLTPRSLLKESKRKLSQSSFIRIENKLESRKYLPWLSFTGGGTRGIIGARMLAVFEEETGKKIRDLFPFMAGTSTGSILSTMATLGFSGKEIVDVYEKYASTIFRPMYYINPKGVRGPMYDIENLRDVIRSYVADKRLADVEGDLLITAYNLSRKKHSIFTSWEAKNNITNPRKNPLLIDLLSASAAAPTYFDPVVIDGEAYADGGLFANDPAACALSEIKARYGKVNHLAVLIGSGKIDHGFTPPGELLGRGALSQIPGIIDDTLSSNITMARYFVKQMLPMIGDFQQVYVIDPPITSEYAALDAVDDTVVTRLKLYADEFIEQERTNAWLPKLIETLISRHDDNRIAQPKQTKKRYSLPTKLSASEILRNEVNRL